MECTCCLLDDRIAPMIQVDGLWYCEECAKLLKSTLDYTAMTKEFEMFVAGLKAKHQHDKYDVLFALSGGKDSVAALYFTIEKYHLRPLVFTVDHGFKNQTIMQNCKKIVEQYNLDWFVLPVDSKTIHTIGGKSLKGDLPCCYCNKLWKGRYFARAIEITGISDLFIGSDTLEQHSAIISRPDYNTDSVGLPLPLNISTEEEIYQIAYSLGWICPQTKGWDTDCIAVGIALENYRKANARVHEEEIKHLSHRVRYGLLKKEQARSMLYETIDISSSIRAQFDYVMDTVNHDDSV